MVRDPKYPPQATTSSNNWIHGTDYETDGALYINRVNQHKIPGAACHVTIRSAQLMHDIYHDQTGTQDGGPHVPSTRGGMIKVPKPQRSHHVCVTRVQKCFQVKRQALIMMVH